MPSWCQREAAVVWLLERESDQTRPEGVGPCDGLEAVTAGGFVDREMRPSSSTRRGGCRAIVDFEVLFWKLRKNLTLTGGRNLDTFPSFVVVIIILPAKNKANLSVFFSPRQLLPF